jgi:curved DNA-binding protein CbpA
MPSSTTSDYYQTLQVDPHAEQEVIHAAFRSLAKKYHPDVYQGPDRDERMRAVNTAYAVLGDPTKRAAYDRERQRASQQQADTQPSPGGKARQPSGQTEQKPQAETGQRQQEAPGRGKTTAGQQHTQSTNATEGWGSGWSDAAREWGSGWSAPLPNQPRRYDDYFSSAFSPLEPPSPVQTPSHQVPVPSWPTWTRQLRIPALVGGTLALLAFFLTWVDVRQTTWFGTASFLSFTGYHLVQAAAWLLFEPVFALALVGYGVFAPQSHRSLRRWVIAPAVLGLAMVLLFLTQSSTLVGDTLPGLTSSLDAGPWVALAGFGIGLIDPFVTREQVPAFHQTP